MITQNTFVNPEDIVNEDEGDLEEQRSNVQSTEVPKVTKCLVTWLLVPNSASFGSKPKILTYR